MPFLCVSVIFALIVLKKKLHAFSNFFNLISLYAYLSSNFIHHSGLILHWEYLFCIMKIPLEAFQGQNNFQEK